MPVPDIIAGENMGAISPPPQIVYRQEMESSAVLNAVATNCATVAIGAGTGAGPIGLIGVVKMKMKPPIK